MPSEAGTARDTPPVQARSVRVPDVQGLSVGKGLGAIAAAALACGALAALPGAAAAKQATVWLCKPGIAANPCRPSLDTTRFSPTGEQLGVDRIKRETHPKVDCFYVYPTVSDDPTPNSDLSIDPEERSIALYQAARYSKSCRVFAPMYRQFTLAALFSGEPVTEEEQLTAFNGVVAAWKTYLKKYNHGRGVVLIGHSQGSFILRQLIRQYVEPKPSVRKRLVSALLLGGNVEVAKGSEVGGDFKRIPGCQSRRQVGCVVAFSTFDAPVPANAQFGRVGGGLTPGDPSKLDILCTNPASLGGGSGTLSSIFPTAPFAPGTTIGAATELLGVPRPPASTPWFEFRGAYTGECSSADDAHVLQITPQGGAPTLNPVPNATWGLHFVDANIALGNLTDLVRKQTKAYLSQSR